jgi:hypothetical protein
MGTGSGLGTTRSTDTERDPAQRDTAPPVGVGTLQLQALFAHGRPDVHVVAQLFQKYPMEQGDMAAWLHGTAGNSYVQSVFDAIGSNTVHAWSPPVRLDPNAPPPPPKSNVPLAKGEDLDARAKKTLAQDLLKATSDTGENARKALEVLLEIDDSRRGKIIDELDDVAFANLIERVPDADRERFTQLLATTRPERKLQLWAEAHKSHAENDIARYKGDAGKDAPLYPHQHRNGKVTWKPKEKEKEQIESTYTDAQKINRKKHERREAAVASTKKEVDSEVKDLLARNQAGKLTMADVDELSERKELEYQIELENNISLEAHGTQWTTSELESLRMTLARLPQVRNPDAIASIDRQQVGSTAGVGAITAAGREITLYDKGALEWPGFRHGGDKREMVSDEFKQKYGDKIGTQEFVITHEVGHDVANQDPKAFEAMTKASGWKKVKVDDLRKDGVSEDDIKTLDARRANPNEGGGVDISGKLNTYAPISGGDEYWALPKTGAPQAGEAAPGVDGDSWLYARVNPDEQFAEIYAKAVHVPEKLHGDLIERPAEAAREAESKVAVLQSQIADLQNNPTAQGKQAKLQVLQQRLADAKTTAQQKETAKAQRAEEFRIMREDVFHTDKAVVLARERLKAKKVSADKLKVFEERVAVASTPEQVAFLEAEAMK